jgi:diacylglycerol kinase (ATP)
MLPRVPRLLIVNPFATRVDERQIERVAAELRVTDVRRTERAGHATQLVREAGAVEAIYVFSGDGGFNEALNGSDGSVPLGFVPGGGTSVLPRALGLPRDPVAAARALRDARTRRIAVGRVNGRRFGFSAGFGLDA